MPNKDTIDYASGFSFHWRGVPRLTYMRAMTCSYVWHDSFGDVIWPIHRCGTCVCVCVIILLASGAMQEVCHGSFICVAWPIHMCAMTPSYVCHDVFIHVTRLIGRCDMTHSHVWHIHKHTHTHTNESCRMWLQRINHVAHMKESWHACKMCGTHESCLTYECAIGTSRGTKIIHMRAISVSNACNCAFIFFKTTPPPRMSYESCCAHMNHIAHVWMIQSIHI